MRLTEVTYGTAKAIEGYGPGFFRVEGHVLRGACLITPWDAGPWGGFDDTAFICRSITSDRITSMPTISTLSPGMNHLCIIASRRAATRDSSRD